MTLFICFRCLHLFLDVLCSENYGDMNKFSLPDTYTINICQDKLGYVNHKKMEFLEFLGFNDILNNCRLLKEEEFKKQTQMFQSLLINFQLVKKQVLRTLDYSHNKRSARSSF